MGRDRVERIWRREGLKVPQKQRPRRRLWLNNGSCIRLVQNGRIMSAARTSSAPGLMMEGCCGYSR